MAIYSLHHQPIGKSTQARPHTSAAHVRYITRPSAASHIEARRMPDRPDKAAAFMVDSENADRKNARVSDKLMLALPRELDATQRAQLVREFAEEVTQGRAPWLAAFHDHGKDAHNPHAHLVVRDRDPATGKRVAGLSEKGSTDRLRALWEAHANTALERAGRPERIDRRTLEAQGVWRAPTVHEGPRAQQMDRRRALPQSRERRYRNRPGSHLPYRDVDYRRIDGGRSRPDYNRHVKRSETPADYWTALDADNQGQELHQLRQIHLRHRPDLVEFPLAGGRAIEPLQGINQTRARIGAGRGLAKTRPYEKSLNFHASGERKSAPLMAQPIPRGQSLDCKHKITYNTFSEKGKGKMANFIEEDSRDENWKANDAKKDYLDRSFDKIMGNSYENKEDAYRKMGEFSGDYGKDALYHELRLNPGAFGAPPRDPARAADAPGYRRELAPTFHDYGKAHDEGERLNRPFDAPPQGAPPQAGGQGKPSGLSTLWERPQSPSSPQPGPTGKPHHHPPTQLQPSSYPLESPFRADGAPQPQAGQPVPQNVPENPFSTLPNRPSPLTRSPSSHRPCLPRMAGGPTRLRNPLRAPFPFAVPFRTRLR